MLKWVSLGLFTTACPRFLLESVVCPRFLLDNIMIIMCNGDSDHNNNKSAHQSVITVPLPLISDNILIILALLNIKHAESYLNGHR